MLGEFGFLLETPKTQHLEALPNLSHSDLRTDLNACVDMLTRIGSRVVYADITTPDIAPLGVRVVRTISTRLQPIHFGYGEERLGGRRLYEVPRILGYTSETRTAGDLNPCPHPLA
jgi:ribosomal protein S12 methylthiotransferase accessory factor